MYKIFLFRNKKNYPGIILKIVPYLMLWSHYLSQEEEASVQITEKGGHQSKVDLMWTKDDIGTIDYVSPS